MTPEEKSTCNTTANAAGSGQALSMPTGKKAEDWLAFDQG
jgi:hypothetical protein